MSKIIPSLVDKSLLENFIQKNNTSLNMPLLPIHRISNIDFQTYNIKNFITKNWLLIVIVLGICIFFGYNHYSKKQKEKQKEHMLEQMTHDKKKKKKKVRIETYDKNIDSCASCLKSGSTNCPSCSHNNNFEGKISEMETNIRDLQHNEHYEHQEHQKHQEQLVPEQIYTEPQQTDYHNQFYGQSITEEAQGQFNSFDSNNIETFNNSSGNYVAF